MDAKVPFFCENLSSVHLVVVVVVVFKARQQKWFMKREQ